MKIGIVYWQYVLYLIPKGSNEKQAAQEIISTTHHKQEVFKVTYCTIQDIQEINANLKIK